VAVDLVNPSLVVVKDPSRADSAAIVLETRVRVEYAVAQQASGLSTSNLVVAVQNLEAFVNLDVRCFLFSPKKKKIMCI